ncbi:M15 family metallopeptidase [Cellulomonas edaphi]|uniref:M15 family metallopeptidase n=1 Tax=Cellulomonas edaphi TaxID=3053468 RepID=A0ABT7S8E1_9CELL|nr:M15 family metallopeptidase [Cellulomons edaphi]MDM7831861.1 M15 family metallopeptidase [Cellulomons edaphi]
MSHRPPRALGAAVVVAALLVGAGAAWSVGRAQDQHRGDALDSPTPSRAAPTATVSRAPVSPTPSPTPAFDLTAHSTTDPASPWVVANKHHRLDPVRYAPDDLVGFEGEKVREKVVRDLRDMVDAAASDGVELTMQSGYRSYAYQERIFGNMLAIHGRDHAERYSARPGYSEHQTGLAVDLGSATSPDCDFTTCFARTPEGRWIAEHAGEYGFLVRYTRANQAVTGYSPEAWHLRWVGRGLTAHMAAEGVTTLEEVFDVDGGPDYR